jgi:LCP family protein required for cell wall assembly
MGMAALVGLMMVVTLILPPLDLLVLGVDARSGEGYVTRTDSIMVLGIQPRLARLNLLSLPRDLFINVPGYSASQRINTINMLGEQVEAGSGPDLLADSIEGSFGIAPDRYVRLNFDAFVQVVDAVGGVRINVPKAIVDYQYPTENYGTMTVRFEPGWQHMNGETALIYARTRHADDDYGRAERQQQVMTALARKLANPLTWIPSGIAVSRNVDTNMNPIEMGLYAPAVMVGSLNMNRLVVNRDYVLPGAQGAVPNYEKLGPWLDGRFD